MEQQREREHHLEVQRELDEKARMAAEERSELARLRLEVLGRFMITSPRKRHLNIDPPEAFFSDKVGTKVDVKMQLSAERGVASSKIDVNNVIDGGAVYGEDINTSEEAKLYKTYFAESSRDLFECL